jgi:two-component system response regulator (stage 0 sporulation protein A)
MQTVLLEHIEKSLAEKPLVLLISAMDNAEFEEQMISAGADYYFIKPVTPQSVAKRIERLSSWKTEKQKRTAEISDNDIEVVISDIMRQIGVPAHIKGYQYLRTAIKRRRFGYAWLRNKAALSDSCKNI